MASSGHRERQLSLAPRHNHSHGHTHSHGHNHSHGHHHSHGGITHHMKTSISIEDSTKKLTITTETKHKLRPISKGNHIALEQEVVNKQKKVTTDKKRQLVKEEKHEVSEKKIVNCVKVEKEQKRIPHKHKSAADGTLEISFKIKK